MPNYKLTYFNVKARAEVPRMLFAKAGVEYEDIRLDQDQFKEIKDRMPFGQIPVLEVDGQFICQSYAIIRFLAKRFGLYGNNEFEEARVDEIAFGMEDIIQPLMKLFHEQDEKRKAEGRTKYEETLPNYLKFLERLLVQNNGGNGFFVGNSISAADLCFIHYITFPSFAKIEIDWTTYPKLSDLRKRVEDDEKIAAWIKNRPVTQF